MTHSSCLTIICGNAGVGKTTLGVRRAQETGALLLDIDTVSEQLVMAGLKATGSDPQDRDSASFKRIYRDAIHETLYRIAEQNLPHADCILVAPFTQERRQPGFIDSLKKRFNSQVELLYLSCSDSERKRRILQRKSPRDEGKLRDWDNYAQSGQDMSPPPFEHQHIDTTPNEPELR